MVIEEVRSHILNTDLNSIFVQLNKNFAIFYLIYRYKIFVHEILLSPRSSNYIRQFHKLFVENIKILENIFFMQHGISDSDLSKVISDRFCSENNFL